MEPYIPQLNYKYPEKPDARMVRLTVTRNVAVDDKYPFLFCLFKLKLVRTWMYIAIFTLVFLVSPIRYGIKIRGRGILRKCKKLLADGAMTVSNHVHRWDFLFILQAVRYRSMYIPVYKENLNGPDSRLIQLAGGVPVPDNVSLIKNFNGAFDEIHKMKKWIHAYPESSRFDYFQPIRPFKKGVFTMAYRYGLPVIPIAFSYRKPVFPYTIINWLRSRTGGQKLPMINIQIGEPLLFDKNLGRKEAVQKMRRDCHGAVVRLAGITHNQYPAEGD
jgi:1-acyl-sn-glycerol-3-phosphate acyltransferase